MQKFIFINVLLIFSSLIYSQSYVTLNTSQTITANKNFSGNFYGFNGYGTRYYTEGLQTNWLISHSRLDVTNPAEPSLVMSRPTDNNPSNPINFSGGGFEIGVANSPGSWGLSSALGDVIFKAEGTSSMVIAAASGNVKFYNLPTYSGSSLATQAWVNSQTYASVTAGTSGYLPKFTSSNIIGNSKIYQSSNGNLLIGKTSQTNSAYILDINGSIRVNELVVNTTGADFVFDSTYKLFSLHNLNTFIKKHHHLPGIRTATQMQLNGISVGENQTKLLQKIEELTLYLIEQNKKQEAQQRKIENLNNKLLVQQKLLKKLKLLK